MPIYSPANPVASIAVLLCWLGFGAVMVRSRMASGEKSAARRDLRSIFGIVLQGLGVALAWAGPFRFSRPVSQADWIAAILPAVIALRLCLPVRLVDADDGRELESGGAHARGP